MTQEPDTPPENPDKWSDQQWIDWLNSTEGDAGLTDEPAPAKTVGLVRAHNG